MIKRLFIQESFILDMDDNLRLSIVKELKDKIEFNIKNNQVKQLYLQDIFEKKEDIHNIRDLANEIKTSKSLRKNLLSQDLGKLMIYMLKSRSQPNIDQSSLSYIEESGEFNDLKSFFKEKIVKDIFVSYFLFIYLGYYGETLYILY